MRLDDKSITLAEFKSEHARNFAILIPTIEAFAEAHDMVVSLSFDPDPLGPHACYFCLWPEEKNQFIRICVQDPWLPGADFYIDAEGKHFSHKRWNYSSASGSEELRDKLENARLVLVEQSAN